MEGQCDGTKIEDIEKFEKEHTKHIMTQRRTVDKSYAFWEHQTWMIEQDYKRHKDIDKFKADKERIWNEHIAREMISCYVYKIAVVETRIKYGMNVIGEMRRHERGT